MCAFIWLECFQAILFHLLIPSGTKIDRSPWPGSYMFDRGAPFTIVNNNTCCSSKAWLQNANRDDLLGKQATELFMKYRICSHHFLARDFMDPAKTRLTRTAGPSVRPEARRETGTAQGHALFIFSSAWSVLIGVILLVDISAFIASKRSTSF